MREILKTVFRFTILGRQFEALRKHSAGKREKTMPWGKQPSIVYYGVYFNTMIVCNINSITYPNRIRDTKHRLKSSEFNSS